MIFLRKRRRLSLNDCHNIFVLVLASLCVLPAPVHSKFRICGFRLTMTMTALCKNQLCGGYFVPTKKRSSSPLTMPMSFSTHTVNAFDTKENFYERRRRRVADDRNFGDDDYDSELSGYDNDEHIINNNINNDVDNNNGMLRVSKRFNMAHGQMYGKRSGIANECCEKRCSLAYLRTYCCSSFQINTQPDSGGQPAAPRGTGAFSYSAAPPLSLTDSGGLPLKHKDASVIGTLAKFNRATANRASLNRATAPKVEGMSKVKQAMLAAKPQPVISISRNSASSDISSSSNNNSGEQLAADDVLDDVGEPFVEEEEDEDEDENLTDLLDDAAAITAQKRQQQQIIPRRYDLQRQIRFP